MPEPAIMQSSGGLISLDQAAGHAALTVLSGPAGGAAGAAFAANAAGVDNALCFDMGGTSCDVCVVDGGAVQERGAGTVAGRPLALPMLAIHTVGAGGGSIAWRDAGGALRVGPRSAGADPGPACYGRGGTEPTVTDANVVLGYLDPASPLAGGVALDAAAADKPSRGWRGRSSSRSGLRRRDPSRRLRRDDRRAPRRHGRSRRRSARLHAAGIRRRRRVHATDIARGARDRARARPEPVRRARRARPGRLTAASLGSEKRVPVGSLADCRTHRRADRGARESGAWVARRATG